MEKAVAAERAEGAKREEKLKNEASVAKREVARLNGELKKARDGSSGELEELRGQISAAATRLQEVEEQSGREAAKREASARHELSIEKAAATKSLAEVRARLEAAEESNRQLEVQLAAVREGLVSATARADGAEAHAARLNEKMAGGEDTHPYVSFKIEI